MCKPEYFQLYLFLDHIQGLGWFVSFGCLNSGSLHSSSLRSVVVLLF